ncbi:hypothetical protein TELCIR_06965 [Teladorsagia circumcincta]|uniref:ERAP1-like C-terminal domain-containing protein n=1 Tax=Teladorsagia circumcincta TaxID=45464 RepID=A0A2G9ULX6_TELCI|nr:hypothetical protein TELCIR_06965 [Teladorsagia circumcincta]
MTDATASTHPLRWLADKPSELMRGVSAISYKKGASFLAMITAILGTDDFYEGVKAFLNKYSYDAVEAYELYEAWYQAGSRAKKTFKNISTFVDFCQEWTDQIGFPLISVKSVNDSTFEVTQERYKKDPTEADPTEYNISPWYNFRWDVPLWYQMNDEPEKMNWLEMGKPLYIPANTASTTIVVNVDRYGFYRQNYDLEGWEKIGKQLLQKHTVYSLRTRNAIISDAFAAALVDRIEYMTALDLLKYLKEEAIYMRSVLLSIYKKEFFDELSRNHTDDRFFFDNKLKMEIIEAICSTGETSCIDEYAKLFKQEVHVKCKEGMRASECVKVAAPLRAGTYCYGVHRIGEAASNKVTKRTSIAQTMSK